MPTFPERAVGGGRSALHKGRLSSFGRTKLTGGRRPEVSAQDARDGEYTRYGDATTGFGASGKLAVSASARASAFHPALRRSWESTRFHGSHP